MDEVEALYQWLAADPSGEADRILAAGLEHAEPAYARRMVGTLLQRRNVTAWIGLVANYDRLDAAARQELATRPEWLRAGIVAAMRQSSKRERLNALTALADHPTTALCYVVADGLRDSYPAIRSLAGMVLRRDAEQACAEREAEEEGGGASSRPAIGGRAELIAALGEAVQAFKFHEQAKVVEAGLWFARDLGDRLWGSLSARHAPVARVVARHLESWDHPRLAGFLLLALAQPTWREAAHALLSRWSTPAHLLALLRHSDLVTDARLRRPLQQLKRPAWIGAAGPDLTGLPANMRARVPLWICGLGFSDEERARWLKRWVASSSMDLHCAAVRALATLSIPQAARVLATVAARPGPMQYFARCYVCGKRDQLDAPSGAAHERSAALRSSLPSQRMPR